MRMPMDVDRLVTKVVAARLRRYPMSLTICSTRSRVAALTSGALLRTLETVPYETPAIRAISLMFSFRAYIVVAVLPRILVSSLLPLPLSVEVDQTHILRMDVDDVGCGFLS